jgi:hypothetical protein
MFDELIQQLDQAAETFTQDTQTLAHLLATIAADVERALAEPLEIFPVAHHSPAAALHLVKRLQQRPPRVIYIELCEDMLTLVPNLVHCKLPVALQAFAAESDIVPPEELPVAVVAPLTESSAEFQAIAYCLQHPETELVFVDRAVDYVFQWKEYALSPVAEPGEEPLTEEADFHTSSIGIRTDSLEPTFDEFLHFLLNNSNTRHFAEWWDQYVERSILSADTESFKQVMVMVGSLIRNLGRKPEDLKVDELRERYMWTRIKQHMQAHQIAPQEALYICGAAHAASHVAEFGTANTLIWEDLPPPSQTNWLFGVIPSSFSAIEHQFVHPPGTISMAETTWQKSMRAANLAAFTSDKKTRQQSLAPQESPMQHADLLMRFLTQPPAFASADLDQLLDWSTRIVTLARNNGYLASTADSIAIYETAMMLANLRNRMHPSAYDFMDAAVTCLEKDRTPRKRNIAHMCRIMLGGDRIGTVGYESLPPLAQNIYDRLAPLQVDLFARNNQRALMDFTKNPELRDCSELLWRLNYLLGHAVVQPIMGERKLGHTPIQESWEIRIGKYQGQVIQLGYEGVTLEQVLEQRMRQRVYQDKATAARALHTAEASLLYLNSPRLTREFGQHAAYLLTQETSASNAPDIFARARNLVHYYRTTPDGLPGWIEEFVATGYTHYASLLPRAMTDGGTSPEEIAGMLGFIFTLESLALSLGCSRSQIVISIQQAALEQIPPEKVGLLWVAEWLLNLRTIGAMRGYMNEVMENPLRLPTLPAYLNGFILSLTFAPQIAAFVVEILSHVFAHVPDQALIPWLPRLVLQLRDHQPILQPLIKEAASIFPPTLAALPAWQPRWMVDESTTDSAAPIALDEDQQKIREMLASAPQSLHAIAQILTPSAT